MTTDLALIGAPSSAGGRMSGQERAPAALREAGIDDLIRESGRPLVDHGDLPVTPYVADTTHPSCQNLPRVVDFALRLRERVEEATSHGRLPLVLGGDCTVGLGVVSGLLASHPDLGLMYFDADLDLNTPATTQSGILDGMVVSHLLGRGAPQLRGIGPREPLLAEEDVTFFGFDRASGWIDPPELEWLEAGEMGRYPLSSVRRDPAGTAREALARAKERSGSILVHFDVDVTSCPAVDVQHPGGLDLTDAFRALEAFVSDPSCVGLVVAELNAERDPSGRHALSIARGLARALRPAD